MPSRLADKPRHCSAGCTPASSAPCRSCWGLCSTCRRSGDPASAWLYSCLGYSDCNLHWQWCCVKNIWMVGGSPSPLYACSSVCAARSTQRVLCVLVLHNTLVARAVGPESACMQCQFFTLSQLNLLILWRYIAPWWPLAVCSSVLKQADSRYTVNMTRTYTNCVRLQHILQVLQQCS
jgi:hypothetical protein